MSGYGNYYNKKLEGAQLYQDFVVDFSFTAIGLVVAQYASRAYQLAVGESRTGQEIKHDEMFAKTGNLWIEISEKAKPRPGHYWPSGIYRNDNAWMYIIGDYDKIFYFAKKHLQMVHRSGKVKVQENNTGTSEGFLLPNARAEQLALIIGTPKASQKISKIVLDIAQAGKELHWLVTGNRDQTSLWPEGL